jgi:hypothetical protein
MRRPIRACAMCSWQSRVALRQVLDDLAPERRSHAERVDLILRSANWQGDRITAARILARWPEISTANLYTAVSTGNLTEVERRTSVTGRRAQPRHRDRAGPGSRAWARRDRLDRRRCSSRRISVLVGPLGEFELRCGSARRRAGTSARRGRWRATRWSVDFSIVVSTLVRTAARKRAGGRHRRGKRATRQCPRSIRKTNDYFAALDQEQYQRAHAMMAEINRNSLPLTQFIQQNHEFHQR